MKLTKRIAAFIIAGILLFAAVACAKPETPGETTTVSANATSGSSDETTESLYDADGYLKDKIPADVNYGGADVSILACQEQAKQFYVDPDAADSGDMLKSALFNRIATLEDRLGVKLVFNMENGNWSNRDAFMTKVESSVKDGSGEYDLVIAYNLNPPVMATKGLLANLSDAKHLDFSNPWYASDFADTVSIDGKIYFSINNSDYGSVRNMACVMFDKTLTGSHSISDAELYKMVLDQKWTLEELTKLIDGTYEEANGNNTPDYGDIYGLGVVDVARLDSFFYGFGLQIIGKQADGSLVMKLDDEKNQNVLEAINKLLHHNDNVFSPDQSMYAMFKSHQAMFYVTPIAIVDQKLDFDFGVMPSPKLDADQNAYRTYISNTHESICIPVGTKTYDMTTDVIECFNSEAYRSIAPVYFETMLKYRYSSDDSASQVYDIIRKGVVLDFGYMFGNSFSNNPFLLFRQKVQADDDSWTTYYSRYAKTFNKELSSIVDALANPAVS
ncbi:MAG: hypothetical protein MJ137_07130 [Clostridia bacterium]|nr:hypothetical protein [Clostridia bacterium]